MAKRTILETGQDMLGDLPPLVSEGNQFTEGVANLLSGVIRAIITKLNGNISLGNGVTGTRAGNLAAQNVDHITPSTPGTEFAVPHDLGRIAVGVDVTWKDRAVDIYASLDHGWDDDTIWLKATVGDAAVKLRVY
jgi:hypothetical protein